jgi:hypothetical protein
MTGPEAIVSTGGLPNGEIRILTCHGRLTFNPRQLRANQRTMNWTFIRGRLARFLLVIRLLRRCRGFISALRLILCRGCRHGLLLRLDGHADFVRFLFVDDLLGRDRGDRRQDGRRVRFLSLSRHPGVLVFVVRVTRRATRLLDVLPNHRHNDVIGEPPLARTVVIQNVTRPKLALLHQELPTDPRWRGKEVRKVRQS